jgi:hypothetical protein
MKRFIITFGAVLSAGAIIFAGYLAWVRLDRWEQAKQLCYVEVNAVNNEENPYSGSDLSSVTASITWQTKRLGRMAEAYHTLQTVLEHKPFGLLLDADDRKTLDAFKADIAQREKADREFAEKHPAEAKAMQDGDIDKLATMTPAPEPADEVEHKAVWDEIKRQQQLERQNQ